MPSGHLRSKDWRLWTAGMKRQWPTTCWKICFPRVMMAAYPAVGAAVWELSLQASQRIRQTLLSGRGEL